MVREALEGTMRNTGPWLGRLMTFHRAAAHSLVGCVPAPTRGTVKASPSPTVGVWHTRTDRESNASRTGTSCGVSILGPQMKSAKCVPRRAEQLGVRILSQPSLTPPAVTCATALITASLKLSFLNGSAPHSPFLDVDDMGGGILLGPVGKR